MSNYTDKTCLVIDHGLNVHVAERLARDFGRVWYHSPWGGALPTSNALLVGWGIPGIERVNDLWSVVDQADLIVVPDVYLGSLQVRLERLGKRVWGSRMGEELELYRRPTKAHLRACGVPVGPYEVVIGLPALRAYLREHEDVYVKCSVTRGDMESFHTKTYRLIEPRLDELEWVLGPKKHVMEFIVEPAIPAVAETGIDTYIVDGRVPSAGLVGIEVKDEGYVGAVMPTAQMPRQATDLPLRLAETFRRYRYRCWFSSEVRVSEDGTPWVIDPTCRLPSPPGGILMEIISNWADICWYGAEGLLIEPEFAAHYGAELILSSSWAERNWLAIHCPPEVCPWLKLRYKTMLDDTMYCIPQTVESGDIGSIVGIGETAEAAIRQATARAEQIAGYGISASPTALNTAVQALQRVQDMRAMYAPSH